MNFALADNKEFIRKLTQIVHQNLDNENFGVEKLVKETGLSLSIVRRRLKEISGKNINQFINEVRLQRALELLQQGKDTAAEVSWKVGFSSPAWFSKSFHQYFGYSPGDVKRKAANGPDKTGPLSEMPGTSLKTTSDVTPPAKKTGISRNIRVIAIAVVVTMVALFGYQLFFGGSKKVSSGTVRKNEKSIAVLPFINDSPDSTNVYFINGIMEAILENLSSIKDVRVVSRNSVEQYRNNKTKSTKQIARELGVNYIVEGSGQKYGDQIKLAIQLIEARTDKHLLSESYERRLEDIFSLQSDVALTVASKITAIVTTEEKALIETPPTTNVAALNMHLLGRNLNVTASLTNKIELIQQAEYFFNKAIELDSTYSAPYTQIGWMYIWKNQDTALYLANRSLHFNKKDAGAYFLQGTVFDRRGLEKEAEEAYLLAARYNPNYSSPYNGLGGLYYLRSDFAKAIEYLLKALQIQPVSMEGRNHMVRLNHYLNNLGFCEEAKKIGQKLIELNNDSICYYRSLISGYLYLNNFESAYKTALKMNFWDRQYYYSFTLGDICLYVKDYKGALDYAGKYTEYVRQKGLVMRPSLHFAVAYLKNGNRKEADWHFDKMIETNLLIIKNNQLSSTCNAYLSLVEIYSALGDKVKAMEYLRNTINCKDLAISPGWIFELKNHPMLEIIRDEPEFRKFVSDMEARFEVERVKIEKVLRDEGMLVLRK